MIVRLQKYLAEAGVASRRKSEEFILSGRVSVNGEIVLKLGAKVDEERDVIEFDGERVVKNKKYVYYPQQQQVIDILRTLKKKEIYIKN